jgi:ABC-type amino acid transport substrate-binding protein
MPGDFPSRRGDRRPWPRRLGRALLVVALIAGTTVPAAEPTLRFGVAADAPPLAFIDEGVLRGLEIDLARALCERLGLQMRLRALPRPRLLDALRGGRIDAVLTSMPADELAVLGLVASEPVLEVGQMALIRADDLARFARAVDLVTTAGRVGYERGTAGARWVQESLPRAERVPLPDAAAGIAALRRGDIEVFIHDAPTVWAVAADPAEQRLVGLFRPLTDERLAWVLRGEDRLLLAAIDGVIRELRSDGRLAGLINRWLPIQVRVAD